MARVVSHDAIRAVIKQETGESRLTPASDRAASVLREALRELIPADGEFEAAFDRWEYLLAMRYSLDANAAGEGRWMPLGQFGWRGHRAIVGGGVPARIGDELTSQAGEWPPIVAGAFDSVDEAREAHDAIIERLARAGWD